MNSEYSAPMNLGNLEELSVLDIAKLIIWKAGKELNLRPLDKLEDDPVKNFNWTCNKITRVGT